MNPHSDLHTRKRSAFCNFFFLIFSILFVFFPLPLPLCHTPTPPICNSRTFMGLPLCLCVFFPSHLFLLLMLHCVQLFSRMYLRSFPPPPLLRLTSIITALDSSSDGKCFSIPLSPSLSLNLRRSPFQITSWLL